jgi:hypothetical protein
LIGEAMDIVAIDPGVDFFGCAHFENKELVLCNLLNTEDFLKEELQRLHHIEKFYIELPQVYQQQFWKGDPNDLIALSVVIGRLAQKIGYHKCELVKPRNWKGTVEKTIMLNRIAKLMTKEEEKLFMLLGLSKSKAHNVLDAIGLGLWAVGRL